MSGRFIPIKKALMTTPIVSLLNRLARGLRKGANVHTPEDEALWERAKTAVDKEHGSHEGKWALVQHIYQQMKAGHVAKAGAPRLHGRDALPMR